MTPASEDITVEAALKELREMFPSEMNLGIERSGGDGYVAAHGKLVINREFWTVHYRLITIIGRGVTLSEAMTQARQWKAEQSER